MLVDIRQTKAVHVRADQGSILVAIKEVLRIRRPGAALPLPLDVEVELAAHLDLRTQSRQTFLDGCRASSASHFTQREIIACRPPSAPGGSSHASP